MDVTPQVINEVEFHQKMRGYDPDEVDDFLERIAVAVGQLSDRVHESEARAATAERRALELERRVRELAERPPSEVEDETETIKRTLVLAQRTADAAVKEAQEEAQRTVTTAQEHADALMTEAQATSRRLVSEAEVEARRASEEARQRAVDEVVTLEETRDALKADMGILERHLEEQRLRLRSTIGDLQRLLDDPSRLRSGNAPELSGASRPAFVADEEVNAVAKQDEDEVIDLDAAAESENGDGEAQTDVPTERPITGGVTFTPPEDNAETEASPQPGGVRTAIANEEGDTDAWARFVREEMLDQPTAAISVPGAEEAYLRQLRRSMVDDSGDSDDRPARTRFGRRR